MCDPNYSSTTRLTNQVSLLRPHYSRYADIVERLANRVHMEVDGLLKEAVTIVAAHDTESWHRSLVGNVKRHNVVDLTRRFHSTPPCRTYQGTGW